MAAAKRKQVKNACTNCQRACKKCDDGRPCGRCVKYGLESSCHNSARKERKKGVKRGPYKRRQGKAGSDRRASVSSDGTIVSLGPSTDLATPSTSPDVGDPLSSGGYPGPARPSTYAAGLDSGLITPDEVLAGGDADDSKLTILSELCSAVLDTDPVASTAMITASSDLPPGSRSASPTNRLTTQMYDVHLQSPLYPTANSTLPRLIPSPSAVRSSVAHPHASARPLGLSSAAKSSRRRSHTVGASGRFSPDLGPSVLAPDTAVTGPSPPRVPQLPLAPLTRRSPTGLRSSRSASAIRPAYQAHAAHRHYARLPPPPPLVLHHHPHPPPTTSPYHHRPPGHHAGTTPYPPPLSVTSDSYDPAWEAAAPPRLRKISAAAAYPRLTSPDTCSNEEQPSSHKRQRSFSFHAPGPPSMLPRSPPRMARFSDPNLRMSSSTTGDPSRPGGYPGLPPAHHGVTTPPLLATSSLPSSTGSPGSATPHAQRADPFSPNGSSGGGVQLPSPLPTPVSGSFAHDKHPVRLAEYRTGLPGHHLSYHQGSSPVRGQVATATTGSPVVLPPLKESLLALRHDAHGAGSEPHTPTSAYHPSPQHRVGGPGGSLSNYSSPHIHRFPDSPSSGEQEDGEPTAGDTRQLPHANSLPGFRIHKRPALTIRTPGHHDPSSPVPQVYGGGDGGGNLQSKSSGGVRD
ncbi:hypothetical protein IWQ60_011108 [Tieghemiomyces parasiticus]|uniref:Zn(2)-C6 fungal-type domain-containing protein n=1 Tax=Tieghemiomyces parasiticus TaxID=78921 RepID=A0A9W8DM15_9FUNG|nr:hypothetical protein IWQ60_011108 [Tieghemiomyces parasiticus]